MRAVACLKRWRATVSVLPRESTITPSIRIEALSANTGPAGPRWKRAVGSAEGHIERVQTQRPAELGEDSRSALFCARCGCPYSSAGVALLCPIAAALHLRFGGPRGARTLVQGTAEQDRLRQAVASPTVTLQSARIGVRGDAAMRNIVKTGRSDRTSLAIESGGRSGRASGQTRKMACSMRTSAERRMSRSIPARPRGRRARGWDRGGRAGLNGRSRCGPRCGVKCCRRRGYSSSRGGRSHSGLCQGNGRRHRRGRGCCRRPGAATPRR